MPCRDPVTRSPGHLFLKYTHHDVQHQISWRFITGVDLANVTILRTEATRLAAKMADATPTTMSIYAWGIKDATGSLVYDENFGPYVGTHAADAYDRDFRSKTISFTGHGNVNVPGECAGPVRCVLYVGNAYDFDPGLKRIDTNSDVSLAAFLNAINISTYLPADYYGQQADLHASAPVQFNSSAQRRIGS